MCSTSPATSRAASRSRSTASPTTGRSAPTPTCVGRRDRARHAERRPPERRRGRRPARGRRRRGHDRHARRRRRRRRLRRGHADLARVDETDSVTGCERVELPVVDPGPTSGGSDPGAGRSGPRRPAARGRRPRRRRSPAPTATTPAPTCGPGARDIPGNRVDEDCAGGDAKRALAGGGRLSFEFLAFRNGTTKAARLLVRDLPAGGQAPSCAARAAGCTLPRSARASGNRRRREPPQADQAPPARGRRARGPPYARRTPPARVIRFKMRARASLPKKRTLCLRAGRREAGALRLRRAALG